MSYTAGPITLSAGVPVVRNNPAVNSGNLSSQAAVIVNLSPFELIVSSGAGNVVAVIDPMTRDLVALDPTSGQQITIDPLALGGLQSPVTISECFVTWYQAGEKVPGNYPTAIAGGSGPFSAAVTFNQLITANSNATLDLSNVLSVYRSAAITVSSTAPQTITVTVETGASNIAIAIYKVVIGAPFDTAFFRIPLTPLLSQVMAQKIFISTTAAGPATVTVTLDTVECTNPGPVIDGANAAAGVAVPTGPNLWNHATVANGSPILGAPSAGFAYYVWGIDAQTAAADIQNFQSTSPFASTSTTTANGLLGTTGNLAGQKVSTAIVYTATAINQSAGVTIRYALGPA